MSLDVPTDIDERGANYHAWCVVCRLRETVCVCWEIQQIRAIGGAHPDTTPRERGPKTIQAREVYYRAHSMDKPGGGSLAPMKCGHARGLYLSQPQTIRPALGVPWAGALNEHQRGRCESGPHVGPVLYLAETQHRRERGNGHQQPNSTSSGVDSDTLATRLLQGGRPAEIAAAGDTWQACRHEPFTGSVCERADGANSVVTRGGEDSAAMASRCNSGLDVDPFPPRTPASPCRSERQCGDPSDGLWRDCSVALGAGDFL